jgi:site-specific DNA-methyltransferase (adenine-specific)
VALVIVLLHTKAMFNISYNPDVLSCLANLSSDEVFTPPTLANQMLDMLPPDIFKNKDTKFLDPVCKSGVFLREIAKRLIEGLETEIPDQQKRINHIFKNQLFGIGITELTSLLSRRSVYCSKTANGKYSICDEFEDEQGNIIYKQINHTWKNGKCKFCGASQEVYDRENALETHAYQFIHTNKPEEIFKGMKFDVIIGNPPYQLSDAGESTGASPIYHHFIEQAKKLNPRFLSMVIPSRWFAGGKGLDNFRESMLNDHRISKLVDYPIASEVFPGIKLIGGVCFFLWERERDESLPCSVTTRMNGVEDTMNRYLNEFDIFVRFNKAIPILEKVRKKG